ncbi:MAG: hypothetical protein H6Q10_206 [Acidobacteria bacterium]|nr:hypothetical protein [Acidobacteriota bacterium]
MNITGTFGTVGKLREEQRAHARMDVEAAGRLVWRDGRGTARFNSVVIRDVSETGAYVESVSGTPIPLYRLVTLQAEPTPASRMLPPFLRQAKVLSAVYRVGPTRPATGAPAGYGLRLLTEPHRRRLAADPATVADPVALFAEATA